MERRSHPPTPGRLSRREFVQTAALGATALAVPSARGEEAGSALPDSAKVYVVHHKDVSPAANEYQPADPDVVKKMVKEAILSMGIGKDMGEVVRGWCPEGKTPATARVKIKFCGVLSRFPAHAGVVNGVVRLLIEDGGVKPENIHVYESCPKNFGEEDRPPLFATPFADTKNRESGVVYSHLGAPMGRDMSDADYRQEVRFDLGGGAAREYTFHFWNALDKDTDILINIPVLKRHIGGFFMTSITLSMKNHYGSIRDAYNQHGMEMSRKIAAVNMAEPIRKKQRLIVVDALYAMHGPGPLMGKMKYGVNKLVVAQDRVAVDYVGWGLLNAFAREAYDAANRNPAAPYRPFAEPTEIRYAAANGVGHRAAKWEDHVTEINLSA